MCSLGEHMSVLFSMVFGSKHELCNFVALVMKFGFTGVEKKMLILYCRSKCIHPSMDIFQSFII